MQILTADHPFQNDNHHIVVMIKLSRYLSIILLTIQTKYFPTNTIIYCQNVPSSLLQQFGRWSDTRSWKTRSMSVPLSWKLLQTNSFVFCFPCSGLWSPLAFKSSPSCFCLWSDVMEAPYFHQRQSHVYVDTGRDLIRVRHQGGNWQNMTKKGRFQLSGFKTHGALDCAVSDILCVFP